MADPTDNTGGFPTQEDLELALLIDRRESFENAYEYWKSQIGGVDELVNFSNAGNPVVAMLAMQAEWRRITEALDRRFRRML